MAILEKVFSIIAPHQCLSCGNEGKLICDYCFPHAFDPIPSRCYKCRSSTDNFEVCSKCRKHSPLRHVWVGAEYDTLAKDLIHSYKFEHSRSASTIIADKINQKLPYFPELIIVPVPTVTTRVRERSFDHAELLANKLGKLTKHRYIRVLTRLDQSRQVGTNKASRLKQLKDAFRVKHPEMIKGAQILLVDDVVTSGATLEESARTLRKAGAGKIDAAVFAQKQ